MKGRVILDMFKTFIRSAESCSSAVNKSSKYEICFIVKAPAHFHDVNNDKIKLNLLKNTAGPHLNHSLISLMLPAHFHNVTYDHMLLKNAAGAHKERSKKYKSNLRTLKSKSYEQLPN